MKTKKKNKRKAWRGPTKYKPRKSEGGKFIYDESEPPPPVPSSYKKIIAALYKE